MEETVLVPLESGVEHLQPVMVCTSSNWSFSFCIEHFLLPSLAVSCSALDPIVNGVITYSSDTTDPFEHGTAAVHSCNDGYSLEGNLVRICEGDGTSVIGAWSGAPPICTGNVISPNLPPN